MPIQLFLQTTAPAASGPGIGAFLFQIGAIFAIFYFLMIRPQQKQRKAHEASILAMKKGDQIVTAGGLVGEIVHIATPGANGPALSDHITIKCGESRLVVVRNRIASVNSEAVAS
jgi:preprotein translocase subunit YajC